MAKKGTYRPDTKTAWLFSEEEFVRKQTAQKDVAEAVPWRLANKDEYGSDSDIVLQELGFTILRPVDGMFYEVNPPNDGWTKHTKGTRTEIFDEKGRLQFIQIFDAHPMRWFWELRWQNPGG